MSSLSLLRQVSRSRKGTPSAPLLAMSGLLALMLAMGIGRFAYTALLPQMRDEGLVDIGSAGVLASVNYLGYLVGALWIAFSRRADSRFRLVAGLLASVVTTLAMSLDLGIWAWYGLRFVAGVASATVYVYATGMVLRGLAERGAPSWSAVHYMGPGAGIALAALVALGELDSGSALGGWRLLGGLAMGAALLAGLVLLRAESEPASGNGTAAFQSAPAAPPLRWLALSYGLAGFGYIVNATFLPVILRSQSGSVAAGLGGWLLVGLAALPATALWVRLSFRWGTYPALIVATLVQAMGVALPVLSEARWAALAGAVMLGATFMGIAGLAQWLARVADPAVTARRIGQITACYGFGQIAGPLLVAWWGAERGFAVPVFAATAALLLSAGLLELSRRREQLG